MLRDGSCCELRPPADLRSVLLAHVLVDLDGRALAVEPVRAVAPRPGDPVVLAGLHVRVVRLEAVALRAAKALAAVVERGTALRERDTTDPRGPRQVVAP